MSDRVYCQDCKWYRRLPLGYFDLEECREPGNLGDDYHRPASVLIYCPSKRNAKNDCPGFAPKPPRRRWWKRLATTVGPKGEK